MGVKELESSMALSSWNLALALMFTDATIRWRSLIPEGGWGSSLLKVVRASRVWLERTRSRMLRCSTLPGIGMLR